MFAAIDLGSNSFRLHIGEYVNGSICVIKSAREPNRLAAGLNKKNVLSAEAFQKGLDALRRLREILDAYPLSDVKVVATNTLRIATNASEFLQDEMCIRDRICCSDRFTCTDRGAAGL